MPNELRKFLVELFRRVISDTMELFIAHIVFIALLFVSGGDYSGIPSLIIRGLVLITVSELVYQPLIITQDIPESSLRTTLYVILGAVSIIWMWH